MDAEAEIWGGELEEGPRERVAKGSCGLDYSWFTGKTGVPVPQLSLATIQSRKGSILPTSLGNPLKNNSGDSQQYSTGPQPVITLPLTMKATR